MNFEDGKATISEGMRDKARNLNSPLVIPERMQLC